MVDVFVMFAAIATVISAYPALKQIVLDILACMKKTRPSVGADDPVNEKSSQELASTVEE